MTAHLTIRILPREAQLDSTAGGIAAFLPGADPAADRSQVRHASIQALAREDADKVSAEIIHHQMHPARGTVDVLEQMAGKAHEIGLGASLGHEYAAPSGLRLDRYKQIAGPLAPGFETVFFRSRRIVSRLICFIPGCARAARSKSSSVQRLAPAGGAEHASAVICASTSVRYRRGLPVRCTSASARSRPPSRYAARVRQIIVRPTPSTCMICASGTCLAKAERTWARLTSRAIRQPFERIASIVRRSFVASRNSVCCMTTPAAVVYR